MTKYAHAVGQNTWSGGEKITPLTKDEAYRWAETHLDADEVEAAFASEIQDA